MSVTSLKGSVTLPTKHGSNARYFQKLEHHQIQKNGGRRVALHTEQRGLLAYRKVYRIVNRVADNLTW